MAEQRGWELSSEKGHCSDSIDRKKEREREEKEKDRFRGRQRRNSVAVGGSFNACTRFHFWNEGRKEGTKASLICCMSAGSDAFIMRPPASKRAPVPPLSFSLSPPSRRRKTAGCFTWSVSRVSACRVHATRREENTSPLPRVDSNGQWRPSRWNARGATVLRLYHERTCTGRCTTTLLFGGIALVRDPVSRGPFTGEWIKLDGVSETIRAGEGGGGGALTCSIFSFFPQEISKNIFQPLYPGEDCNLQMSKERWKNWFGKGWSILCWSIGFFFFLVREVFSFILGRNRAIRRRDGGRFDQFDE